MQRRGRQGLVWTLAPDDAFWTLLLHCLIDKGEVAAHHRRPLQEVAPLATVHNPLALLVEKAIQDEHIPEKLVDAARNEDWSLLEDVAPSLSAKVMRRFSPDASDSFMERIVRMWRRAAYLRRRGLSVALLGPDGAGKSTLSASIPGRSALPARRIYMGLYHPALARLEAHRLHALVAACRLLVTLSRYLVGRYFRSRGRLVVFDRYPYDALLSPRESEGRMRQLYRWVVAHSCPAPDLVLLLDASGDVMYQRKGRRKHTPEQLEANRRQYLMLKQRLRNLEVIDANRGIADVQTDAMHRIWQRYRERWRRQL